MSDLRHDVAELAADLRASIDALRAAGWTIEPPAPPPESLANIHQELGDCRRCGLCEARSRIVFGSGDARAPLMVVGEAPGEQEDLSGEPFVGAAGEMLDKMLERVIGLRREQVYIANVVKCRPPGNRDPSPAEIETCLPFLRRQIRAVRPKVILVLGAVAYRALLGTSGGITQARGRWREVEGIDVMPTFHPAYLMRAPERKRDTLHDLKAVAARLSRPDRRS